MTTTLVPHAANGHGAALAAPTAQVPLTFSDVERMAQVVASSGLFGVKGADQALALMMLCQAEGLHPMQAVRRYHLIQGRPAMRADAMQAEFQARGGEIEFSERSDACCEAIFTWGRTRVGVRWDMERAKRAGLLSKGGTWQQFPAAMLHARCVSEGVRAVMPAVVVGLYTPEEVETFAEPAAVRVEVQDRPEATPAPRRQAAPALPQETVEAIQAFGSAAHHAGFEIPLVQDKWSLKFCRQAALEVLGKGGQEVIGEEEWRTPGPWIAARALLEVKDGGTLVEAAREELSDPFGPDEEVLGK